MKPRNDELSDAKKTREKYLASGDEVMFILRTKIFYIYVCTSDCVSNHVIFRSV